MDSGLDIINFSAGNHLPDCNQQCRICTATKQIIDSGISVVVSAGNKSPGESSEIFCPGRVSEAITVGGFVTECQGSRNSTSSEITNPPQAQPPGAYWADTAEEIHPLVAEDVYCGQNGCTGWYGTGSENTESNLIDTIQTPDLEVEQSSSMRCEQNKYEREWKWNVDSVNDKPNVLAPVHYPVIDHDGNRFIDGGTSYAAPIVTAVLANVLGELFQIDKYPEPATQKRILVETSKKIDQENAPAGKIDCVNIWEKFGEHYNI